MIGLVEEENIEGIRVKKYSPENGSKNNLVILMVHGMFGGDWYFESWAKFLQDIGFQVYVLNLRGHNGSFCLKLGSVSIMDYVSDVKKVADYIYKKYSIPPVMIAHSMGGLIAQKMTEVYPYLVKGLVLVASAPPKGISVLSFLVLRKIIKHMLKIVFNKSFNMTRKDCFSLVLNNFNKDDTEANLVAKKFMSTPESGKAAKELALSLIPVDHRKINCKTLIVAGSKDKICPLNIQWEIKEKYYFSDYFQFERGHMLMLEPGWEKVISKISDWISMNIF